MVFVFGRYKTMATKFDFSSIVIEHSVPITPGVYNTKSLKYRTVLPGLSTGDSFLVKTNAERTLCLNLGRKTGIKLRTRKVPGGFRIWKA